jgi:hypothetical protein
MGVKGPIPKHSSERVRRNQDEGPIEKITAIGTVEVPELGIPNPHPLVASLYESMKTSAQSKFYEDSDWAYARFTFHFANKLLRQKQPSAMLLSSVNQMLTSLLLTEGDRRRVRIEVERQQAEGVVIDVAKMFEDRLKAQSQAAQ